MVNLSAAKGKRYLAVLKDIRRVGVCPFCPENFKWHTKPILKRTGDWLITENFNPYKNARYHFLAVKRTHKEKIEQLSPKDWRDLASLIAWANKKFKIKGGGIAMRFGEPLYTGATVRHIHAHLLVPEVKKGKARPISFPIG